MPPAVKLQFTPQEDDTDDYILRVNSMTRECLEPYASQSGQLTDYQIQWPAELIAAQNTWLHEQTLPAECTAIPPLPEITDTPTAATGVHAVTTRHQSREINTVPAAATSSPAQQQSTTTSTSADCTTDDIGDVTDNAATHLTDITDATDTPSSMPEQDWQLMLADYLEDDEFKHVVNYKWNGLLSGSDAIDRKTLFTCDSYVIMNDKLYRVTEPCAKRQRNVAPVQPAFQNVPSFPPSKLITHYAVTVDMKDF